MFRRYTFTTLVRYLTKLRIARACALLVSSGQPVAVIAAQAGFGNLSLFNRQFVDVKGETPSAFRKRHQVVTGGVVRRAGR